MHELINEVVMVIVFLVCLVMSLRYLISNRANKIFIATSVGLASLMLWALSHMAADMDIWPFIVSDFFHYWIAHSYVVIPGIILVYIASLEYSRVNKE